jgi:thioester reductase-like protein
MKAWLRDQLLELLKVPAADAARVTLDADFFALGLDSLGAYRMFSRIMKTLDLGARAAEVPGNVCFEYPSLRALAAYLSALRAGASYSKRSETDEMQVLVDQYATFTARTPKDAGAPRGVLLTGATGSLGAHLLAELLRDPKIERVYCLNRGADAHARTLASLRERKLDAPLDRIESLTADLTKPDLGLGGALARLRESVNLVLHNAWSVNFNMGVASFAGQIQATRNLADFGLASGARFFFVSSVSSAVRSGKLVRETDVEHLTDAQEHGYGRSKLVGEWVCRGARRAGLDARAMRVGQIVGDTRHGAWNATEAIPLMLRSALTIGALPTLNDTLSWLPVDDVARVIVELCHAPEPHDVYHVVNPRLFNWTKDLLPMLRAAGLSFESVSPQAWLEKLAASNPDPTVNPTIKLLDFFKTKYANPSTGPAVVYETRVTEAASPTLKAVQAPDAALVRKMVEHWRAEDWK